MHTNTQLYAHMLGARIAVIWVLTKRNQEERKFCCDMGFDKKKSRGKEVLLWYGFWQKEIERKGCFAVIWVLTKRNWEQGKICCDMGGRGAGWRLEVGGVGGGGLCSWAAYKNVDVCMTNGPQECIHKLDHILPHHTHSQLCPIAWEHLFQYGSEIISIQAAEHEHFLIIVEFIQWPLLH